MSSEHTPHDDIVYDLISIQYHSLKAASVYDKFLDDAHDHADVADFIRRCRQEDQDRAGKCHELIKSLMGADRHQAA